ncbi:CerR family C-terminal domain-containing protein [Acidovorax sp. SUPP3334]|uniref:CerR family C-terminal domain-containing protein n=1 Tax=Acidovorax sp. SUPP3334 TaxID=2920881 RepID=UPI0023DE5707|nr:CerR family C-terminal domain-containing protein [Acidovorax sp. SUPP3334]GKT22848.1 CerR family C-terminal domain-containing protein [Acidovorax sp. SUPP3334]
MPVQDPSRAAAETTAGAPSAPSARLRLLHAALRLFAEHGYAKTSIRAIAQAAQANVAAVSYYYGDKAALYAALFSEPFGDMPTLVADFSREGIDLREAMQRYFRGVLAPLQNGEMARQYMRLHIREMLEPTAQWEKEIAQDVRQPHDAMVRLLGRHLGVQAPDDGLHRLALAITGMAFQIWSQQEILAVMEPQLLAMPDAVDAWTLRFTEYALAMVAAERALRTADAAPPATRPPARRPAPRRR